jgi:hypothetical protein
MSRDGIIPDVSEIRHRYENAGYGPEIEATIEALLIEIAELEVELELGQHRPAKAHTMSERGEVK